MSFTSLSLSASILCFLFMIGSAVVSTQVASGSNVDSNDNGGFSSSVAKQRPTTTNLDSQVRTKNGQGTSRPHYDIEKCLIEVGRGKDDVINLEPLTRRDGYPRFHDNFSVPIPDFNVKETYDFTFNPCVVYSLPKHNPHDCFADGCHNAIICKSKPEEGQCHYLTLGYHGTDTVQVKLTVLPNNDTRVSIVYTGLGSQRHSKAVVKLVCDRNRKEIDEASFQVVMDNGQGFVIMELHHQCCCLGGCWNQESNTNIIVLVGAFGGLILIVLLIATMCYVKKTHTQFYSKLPGINPNPSSNKSNDPTSGRKNSLIISIRDKDLRDYEPVGPTSGRNKPLPILDDCVIPFVTVEMRQRLGGNQFGDTHLGTWKEMTVTVKRLTLAIHDNQLTQDTVTWMKQEVALISRQRHKNIVSFIGICLDSRLPCLLTEYVVGECLKDYLRCSGHRLSWPQKIRMCNQIADGMTFLHSKKPPVIHRDLRCGNVFLCDNNVVKVADFSLIKLVQPLREQCDSDDCSCQRLFSACPASIRWTAPELLSNPRVMEGSASDKVISPACDVYSFGLLMWEMVAFQDPFSQISSETEVMKIVMNGGRPDVLKGSDMMVQYRDLMKRCWDQQPGSRPTFKHVAQKLKDLVSAARNYQKQVIKNHMPSRHPKTITNSSPV